MVSSRSISFSAHPYMIHTLRCASFISDTSDMPFLSSYGHRYYFVLLPTERCPE